ncbi:MAG: 2-oxoacid:acceptor oxidoreductase subunit alpha [Riemerella sp.]|nr:MAG: 2-oxoacid:acceptor oxidoreductase subunit alpha [Riemerella sp.]
MNIKELKDVTILFAGDSGDGMQFTGSQFSQTVAFFGNDLSTLPDFPAEIRAPSGTIAGVSGFQIHFGSREINSPGDSCDVLVAMNAAALKKNLHKVKQGGILIINSAGFDRKNLALADYERNPIESLRERFTIHEIDITKNTLEALKETSLSQKEKDRSKNMFALGFIYWLFSKDVKHTEDYIEKHFSKNSEIKKANIEVLKAGYKYGEIAEVFTERFAVEKAEMQEGIYRSISGNEAVVLGVLSAAQKAGLELFYGGYPITPASDILHYLSKYKPLGVKTFQAEDEIAAMTAVIGAAFAGDLGITATSGPGMALKTEGLGLAFMLELPMVVVNVQRGGPSTGLPTKTEQADLLQAVYGRNGEAPIPVIAAKSPSDCFAAAFQAVKIALEHTTPVILLSDGYLGNGTEPWLIPDFESLPDIHSPYIKEADGMAYQPYAREENLSRRIAVPGVAGKEHVVGGLEKQDITGHVSYDSANHQKMVKLRAEKFENISASYPPLSIDQGGETGEILLLSWGSSYGSIRDAVKNLLEQNVSVSHLQLRNLAPFPKDLGEVLGRFKKIIIPEINNGQLIKLIQDKYQVKCIPFNKIQGTPFLSAEIEQFVLDNRD